MPLKEVEVKNWASKAITPIVYDYPENIKPGSQPIILR
jgi:hypothetical protein